MAVDNHTFVNALPWMRRTGAPRRDPPERYGKWTTVCRRFNRRSGNGATGRPSTALREGRTIGAKIRVPAMDPTSVKVAGTRPGRRKKGLPVRRRLPGRGGTPKFAWHPTARACVFCQIEVVQNSVSVQSEKAAGFSPIKRKTRRRCSSYPIRAWVRLYDSPSNLIILP